MKINTTSRVLRRLLLMGVAVMLVLGVPGVENACAATKKPTKVILQSVKSHDYNAVKLTWEKNTRAKKYQVYRATSKNGTYKLVKTTTGTSYVNRKLTTGKKYYYKVRGVNGDAKGPFSVKKYAVPKLKQVKGLKAKKDVQATKLSWNKVKGAKGYQVYRSKNAKGKFKKVMTSDTPSYWDDNVTFGKTYYYKVRAYRVTGKKKVFGSYSKVFRADAYNMQALRNEMLAKVNAERKKKGLVPLKLYAPVNETAQEKAKDMYKTGVFSHQSKNLGYFYDQYDKKNLKYFAGAENIAWGQGSVASVMEDWMNSKGHKANILGYKYTHLGVGYSNGYWVQQFIARSDVPKNPVVTVPDDEDEDGFDMKCRSCKKTYFQKTERILYSYDPEGNKYAAYQCTH